MLAGRRPTPTSSGRVGQEDVLAGDQFAFADLEEGIYEVIVEAVGFEVVRETMQVVAGRDQYVFLRLRPEGD